MGLCGSKSDLKLEEVTITEKPPEAAKPAEAAAETPSAEALSAGSASAADDGVAAAMAGTTSAEAVALFKKNMYDGGRCGA